MPEQHIFADTNFFVDRPYFLAFEFDDQPFTLVICDTVLSELDQVARQGNTMRRAQADEATERILRLLNGAEHLALAGARVVRYDYPDRASGWGDPDGRIIASAKRYARVHLEARTALLTADANIRAPAAGGKLGRRMSWRNRQRPSASQLCCGR